MTKNIKRQVLEKAIENLSDDENEALFHVIFLRKQGINIRDWVDKNCLCNHDEDISDFGTDMLMWNHNLNDEISKIKESYGL